MNLPLQPCMTMDSFKEMLKERGFKATPQRLAVHSAMMNLVHASADQVVNYIAETSKTPIQQSSVYNILLQFSSCGIYHSRMSSTGKMFFDVDPRRHMHLYDSRNETYRDVYDDELMDLIHDHLRRRRFKGYKVDDIDIQILAHPTSRKLGL